MEKEYHDATAASTDASNQNGPMAPEPLIALTSTQIAGMTYIVLSARKELVEHRLRAIGTTKVKQASSSVDPIPYSGKSTDTHWDFLMKEMMWLAADFQSERKRQLSSGKKLASAVNQWFTTKESRRVRELAQAELKRRRLAAKIGRLVVKGWWTKIERVIAYKQKISSDMERRKAMNQQLVQLVKQTERYRESLFPQQDNHDETCDTKEPRQRGLTIEQALQAGEPVSTRRTKALATDYTRLDRLSAQEDFYGETTTSDSGSDGSFLLQEYSTDDESTLLEAETTELKERRRQQEEDDDDDASYFADPEELRKLQEEGDMDVNDVLERLRQEALVVPEAVVEEGEVEEELITRSSRRSVRLARHVYSDQPSSREGVGMSTRRSTRRQIQALDAGNDADDDADASDVEDYDEVNGSDEFEADPYEMDDETTIAAEERLGQEMSPHEEIQLLQQENEMSVEELRQRYSAVMEAEKEEPQAEASSQVEARVTRSRATNNDEDHALETIFEEDDDAEAADEFRPEEMEVDDETTLEAEERLGRELSPKKEIALLRQDGEIPIEQLRAMYGGTTGDGANDSSMAETDSQASVEIGESLDQMREDGEDNESGDDFLPDALPVVETTTEVEERLGREKSCQNEINLLKRGNEMSVDELRRMYGGADNYEDESPNEDNAVDEAMFEEDDNAPEDEFQPAAEAVDDETTLEAEERLGREMSVEDEIALLQKESATPVSQLRAMYREMIGEQDEEEPASTEQDESVMEDQLDANRQSRRKRPRSESDRSETDGDEGLAALRALKVAEERAMATRATRPFLLSPWVKLREYQQIGLNWLVSIQTRRLNGILADEMGLGKTLQTIALLAYLAAYKGIWGPHLIVVPTSTIVNWETEFKRFCPGLKVLCYYGSAKRRKELRSGWTKSNWHHVIVTSYQLVVQDSFAFKRKKWYYLVLDEAHNIKNFESQRWQTLINFNTQRRLLLTGTPLQNNLMELWSLLHFLMPHVFRSRKEFSYWFSNPMNQIIEGNVNRSDELITRLHGIIRPFVLRRLKKDVETQMPGKFEHIVKCQLSRRQMFLYEEFMARSSTRQALQKGGNFMGMMNVLMQLRKVCNHPDLFEPRPVITPFVMDRISFKTADMAAQACASGAVEDCLSTSVVHPLWCCADGSVDDDLYLSHDSVRAEQLRRLEEDPKVFDAAISDSVIEEPSPTEEMDSSLVSLLEAVRANARKAKADEVAFQMVLNSQRCRKPAFPYCRRLVTAVTLETNPLDRCSPEAVSGTRVISTPMQLLALRRSQQERADDLDDIMKKFVFCVPKVGAPRPVLEISSVDACVDDQVGGKLDGPLEEYFRPFEKARARLSSFFPDKKLIQFDAGKLQILAKLLRKLKQGGHRALIFTQMSKILDVLEVFLNLNGHTYLRLDGSTGVDRRQRMMDRFNNDPKIFCFILSTRSGGLGINLTGADSVIFYDSDWNPAMDAQAQDRAHRIGQTRDVHIYRLITEHSIEENILIKAQQKKNLDLLVMDEGRFDASSIREEIQLAAVDKRARSADMFTRGGLRSILGVGEDVDGGSVNKDADVGTVDQEPSKEQMEQTMASLEDEDDVRAMRGAQQEAVDELKEFDETIEIRKEESGGDDDDDRGKENDPSKDRPSKESKSDSSEQTAEKTMKKIEEDEMVREFETWQNEVGMDASAIANSLSATERYAMTFREEIDPFYSIFAIAEYKRKLEAEQSAEQEIDLDELERQKAMDELQAIEDGDLLGTNPLPEDLLRHKHMYCREKLRLRSNKKRRKLTGENWGTRIDGATKLSYWYNSDTGEAIWDKPLVLIELEDYERALQQSWNAMPLKPLVRIMEFLITFPERTSCSLVCRQWRLAASDVSFVRHVYPVEMGALAQPGRHLEHSHYRTIEDALSVALPGDTIELGDGHYWVSDPGLNVTVPLRIIGDEHEPSHVTLELSGTVQWGGRGGWIEGVTFRRPRMASGEQKEILRIHKGGRVDLGECVLDNEGSKGTVVVVDGEKSTGKWFHTHIRGSEAGSGIVIQSRGSLDLFKCNIMNNYGFGISCTGSSFQMKECVLQGNGGGIRLFGGSKAQVTKSRFVRNGGSVLDKDQDSLCSPCNGNVAIVSSDKKALPGFQIVTDDEPAEGVSTSNERAS